MKEPRTRWKGFWSWRKSAAVRVAHVYSIPSMTLVKTLPRIKTTAHLRWISSSAWYWYWRYAVYAELVSPWSRLTDLLSRSGEILSTQGESQLGISDVRSHRLIITCLHTRCSSPGQVINLLRTFDFTWAGRPNRLLSGTWRDSPALPWPRQRQAMSYIIVRKVHRNKLQSPR